MIKVLVVADDMTGANDTGALIKGLGMDTVAAIGDSISQDCLEGKEVLCLNTDSRAMKPDKAEEKVKAAIERYWSEGMLCCKRIDSTLRGNIGSEINGLLEALPQGYKAVVVPAFPRAGRICVRGQILVNGVSLIFSDAGKDKKTPVTSSMAAEIIGKQSNRKIKNIFLEIVQGDQKYLVESIKDSDADILVVDAVNESDIEKIADACVKANIQTACVDPGAFSFWMARKRFIDEQQDGKNLLVIGSLSVQTRRQVQYFEEKNNPLLYKVSVQRLVNDYEAVKEETIEFLGNRMNAYKDICILTDDKILQNCSGEMIMEAEIISERFSKIGVEFFNRYCEVIDCVYLCGGDIAKDFLKYSSIEGIDICEEVLPLAVYGKTIDKKSKSIQILTKGGMIGQDSTICDMLNYAQKVR